MVQGTVLGTERLEQARAMLADVEKGYEDAFKAALQKTTGRVSRIAAREIRKHYAVYEKDVKKNSRSVSVVYSHQLGVRAELTFAGHKIPLHKFGGSSPSYPTQDRSRPRVPVTKFGEVGKDGSERWYWPGIAAKGHQLASTAPSLFMGAFVAKMPSGHIGIFERTAAMTAENKGQISEIMGGSVAQMLENEEVRATLDAEAKRIFDEETEKWVTKTLENRT